jgi:hypothetical protein
MLPTPLSLKGFKIKHFRNVFHAIREESVSLRESSRSDERLEENKHEEDDKDEKEKLVRVEKQIITFEIQRDYFLQITIIN